MLRRVIVVSALLSAACGGKPKDTGPAWPKSAGWETPETWEEDGGESLEPKAGGDVAQMEHSEDAPTLDEILAVELPDEPPPEPTPEEPKVDDTFVPEETIIIIEGDPAP
jgi:hypothetical protein